MWEKLKSYYNKNYAILCSYIIGTAIIIFILASAVMKIENIFSWLGVFFHRLFEIFTPVIIGLIIAYLLDPLSDWFSEQLKKIKFLKFKNDQRYRTLGVVISFIVVIVLVISFILAFVFSITKQLSNNGIDQVVTIIADYIRSFSDSIKDVDLLLERFNIDNGAITDYVQNFATSLINTLSAFANNLVLSTMSASSHLTGLLIGVVIAIYVLLDKQSFMNYGNMFAKAFLKDSSTIKVKGFFKDFDEIFSGYIRGQMADVLFMCAALSITLSIIGIKFGVLIGIFAGLCNIVPYFGPIVAYAGTISFGLLNGQFRQVIIAVICLFILQQIDGSYIGPKLMGRNIALKPVFILVAVTIGGEIFGFVGMVLAVPVAGMIKLILTRIVDRRIVQKDETIGYDEETNTDVAD